MLRCESVTMGMSDTGGMNGVETAVQSGSNLAFALGILPPTTRRDMRVFYAFCRVVDDLSDEPGIPYELRRQGLERWMALLRPGMILSRLTDFEVEVLEVFSRREVPLEWAAEIVRGCQMDLDGYFPNNWEELRCYCFRVASAVGLVSAKIFGGAKSNEYAENLGIALQLTNILRDSARDYGEHGRVYFPKDELLGFGIAPGKWAKEKPENWDAFMRFQYDRAFSFYRVAEDTLAESDVRVMASAEIMRVIYFELLERMRGDGFRVWEEDYRLGNFRKLWLLATSFFESCRRHSRYLAGNR